MTCELGLKLNFKIMPEKQPKIQRFLSVHKWNFEKICLKSSQKKPQKFLRFYINYISRSLFDKSFAFQ